MLGVRSVNGLAFYDWENTELIRRIEIQPKHVKLSYFSFRIGHGLIVIIMRSLTMVNQIIWFYAF